MTKGSHMAGVKLHQLLEDRERLIRQLDTWIDPRPGWRKEKEAVEALIAFHAKEGDFNFDDNGEAVVRPPAPRGRNRVSHGDGICLVPECGEKTTGERCTVHAARFTKSEHAKSSPNAIKCPDCPEEAGGWVKGIQGLAVHRYRIHNLRGPVAGAA
jgi:hypothetical protein